MKPLLWISLFFGLHSCSSSQTNQTIETEVLVISGGTGGVAAGIAAARKGVKTLIIEEGPWLGGMISAAGVTCTDGNHNMPSGLWSEFREKIYAVYGGPKAVATGWVSHTQFEPHVSDSIWKSMAAAEKNLQIMYGWRFEKATMDNGRLTGATFSNKQGEILQVKASISIDASELGDVLASAGVPFSLGMEAGNEAGEDVGVTATNDIVQDLTWVATLKDYGKDADCTIAKPNGYDPMEFDGVCTEYYNNKAIKAPNVDAKKMLDYGRLPNGKYMINWPNSGNDTYLNVVNLTYEERQRELEKSKQTTLRFVYFIQTQLGFKNLGLADDEFPTEDRLALMPYHREGRRLQGLVRMNIKHVAQPFNQPEALYRTGISVGDYPIDHHHKKNPDAPQHLEFYPVPSYNIPLGALIPEKQTGLIVAEKGISVTNVVNGTTRLQPVVILTGQAAGTLAALCVQQNKTPQQVSVREVQDALLKQKAYIMPYYDVPPNDPHFDAIQRIGATGIIKGRGEPYLWANRTWFSPDSLVTSASLSSLKGEWFEKDISFTNENITIGEAITFCFALAEQFGSKFGKTSEHLILRDTERNWNKWGLNDFSAKRNITRREFAVLLDKVIEPF
ncbi:MAG: FAD-dependent oxidoreductase, partial [Chitinophagaceae bacterium]|nr:FAD-dependent oxidoreductase [Chitinophagaceae bacterium]